MTDLTPARMINEWIYCPRLAYLEWVEGEWMDNEFTLAQIHHLMCESYAWIVAVAKAVSRVGRNHGCVILSTNEVNTNAG